MENNEIKAKNKIIPIIIIIFLLLVIVFLCLYSFTDIFKRDISNTNNDEVTENKEETTTKKYMNYTYLDDLPVDDMTKKLVLEVKDGNLIASIDGEELQINGLEGRIRSFIIGHTCAGRHRIVAINEDNKVFITHYYSNGGGPSYSKFDKTVPLNFKEIKTNEEIVDITKQKYAGYTTCGEYNTAVVLKNGEIRMVYEKNDPSQPAIEPQAIGTLDYSQIKTKTRSIAHLVLYSDDTVSKGISDGNNGQIEEKITYENKELKVEKIIDTGVTVVDNINQFRHYIISENKLYEIIMTFVGYTSSEVNTKVSLINESSISSEKIDANPVESKVITYIDCPNDENYTDYNNATDTITFEDGTTFDITGITSIYNNK